MDQNQVVIDLENPIPQVSHEGLQIQSDISRHANTANSDDVMKNQPEEIFKKDIIKIQEKLFSLSDAEKQKEEQQAQDQLWKDIKRRMLSTNLTDRRALGGLLGTAILGIIGLAVGLNVIGIVIGGILGALLGTYAGRKIKEKALKKKKLLNVNIEIVKFAAFSQQIIDWDSKTITPEEVMRLIKLLLNETKMLIVMNQKLQKSEKKQFRMIQKRLLKCFKKKKYLFAIKTGYWIVKEWCKQQNGTVEEKQQSQLVEKQVAEIAFQYIRPLAKLMSTNRKFSDQSQKKFEEKMHSLLLSIPIIELNEKYPEFLKRYEAASEDFLENIYKEVDFQQLKAIIEDEIAQEILREDQNEGKEKEQKQIQDNVQSLKIDKDEERKINEQENLNPFNQNKSNGNQINISEKTKTVNWGSPPQNNTQLQTSMLGKQRLIDLIQLASQKHQVEILSQSQNIPPNNELGCSTAQFPSRVDIPVTEPHLTPMTFLEDGQKFTPFQLIFQQETTRIISRSDSSRDHTKASSCRLEQVSHQQTARTHNHSFSYGNKQISNIQKQKEGYIIPKNIADDRQEDEVIESITSLNQNQKERQDSQIQNNNDVKSNKRTKSALSLKVSAKQSKSKLAKSKKKITQSVYSLTYKEASKNFKETQWIDKMSPPKQPIIIPNINEILYSNTVEGIKECPLKNENDKQPKGSFMLNHRGEIFLKMNSSEDLIFSKNNNLNSVAQGNDMILNTDISEHSERISNGNLMRKFNNNILNQKEDISAHDIKFDISPKQVDNHCKLSLLSNKNNQQILINKKLSAIQEILQQDLSQTFKLIHNSNDINIYTKQLSTSPLIISKIKLAGCSSQEVLEQIYNSNKRKQWDKFSKDYQVCETTGQEEDIIYFYIDLGFGITRRDYLHKRILKTDFPNKGETTILFYSTTSPSYPEKKGFIRAFSEISAFVIQKCEEDVLSSTLKIIILCDIKGTIPKSIINFISTRQSTKWVESLRKQIIDSRLNIMPEIIIKK